MTFYTWLLKNYKKQKCPQGDLARFLKGKRLRTNSRAHERNFAALMCGHPDENMVSVFETAWEEYEILKERRLV